MSLKNLQAKMGLTADGAFGPGTLNAAMKYYNLTPVRAAHFFAQTGHESGEFKAFAENLNYSAKGLRGVFGKYFPTDVIATQYERQPEKIANRVYANRMGNGDEASGDGYRYCGRGLIQLTGKQNYSRFAESIDTPLEEITDFLQTFEGCVQSAAWFWEANNLNQYADSGDMLTMTKRINGGTLGLDDRTARFNAAIQLFQS